ncbi:LolA-like protein [Spirosoma areae]
MKKQLITLVALVAIPAFSFAQTADEILDKHVAALGGADKVAAVKTMELEQTMAVMGMELTSKSNYVVGKSMRSDVSVMGQQITTVIDGDKGWAINPMQGGSGAQDMPAEALKAAKNLTEPQMLHLAYVKANKYPYELIGKEKYNSKDAFNLKVTRPEGAFNYFIDADTYQLMGLKGTGPQGEVTATFSDYKAQDGLTMPYASEITAPGAPGPITAKTTKVSVNNTVDPAIFAKPK